MVTLRKDINNRSLTTSCGRNCIVVIVVFAIIGRRRRRRRHRHRRRRRRRRRKSRPEHFRKDLIS